MSLLLNTANPQDFKTTSLQSLLLLDSPTKVVMHTKIAHITDLHLDEDFPQKQEVHSREHFRQVLEDIRDKGIKEIVCTGDIGENKGIEHFFRQLADFDLAVTLGNHDSFGQVSPYLNKKSDGQDQKHYYSTYQEGYQCIYLDSSQGVIDPTQLQWLRKALDTTKPILIFVHHPILGLELKVDEIGRLQNRGEVRTLLENTLNEITIFCGHYHMESYLQYKNIRQHITPAVSYQIEKNKNEIVLDTHTFGYRIIHLENGQVSSKIQTLSHANKKTVTH